MRRQQKKIILLVEGDPIQALAYVKKLKKFGYVVIITGTRAECVSIVETGESIDLILMDVDPRAGIDGTEATRQILAQHQIPIVFHVSDAGRKAAEKAWSSARYGCIPKNADEIILRSTIAMALELFDAHRRLTTGQSERRQAEFKMESLITALQLKNHLFDESIIANSIVDTDGVITEANNAFVRIWGYSNKDEVVGKPFTHFLDDPNEAAAIVTGLERSAQWEGDYTAKRKDGSTFTAHGQTAVVMDAGGVLIGTQSAVMDITERMQAEETLRETNEYLENLFNYANAPIIVWDTQFLITRFNHAFEKLSGYTAFEVIGRRVDILFPEDKIELSLAHIHKTLTGEKWETIEIDILTKEGDVRTVLWNSANIFDTRGKEIVATIAQGNDITERNRALGALQKTIAELKHAEERTLQQQRQLIQADKMASLGVLVSGIAHEINNPNNLVMFNSDLVIRIIEDVRPVLNEYYEDNPNQFVGGLPYNETRKKMDSLLNGITIGAQRIRDIVGGLKDFVRPDAGDIDQPIRINEIIRSALLIVNNLIRKSTNKFIVEYAENIPVIRGNAQQVEQVIINLITNACQALSTKTQAIHIRTAYCDTEQQVHINVTDDGIGIPIADQKKIFDPFFTTKKNIGGTGLGLSISYGIVQAMQGELRVHSVQGKGTTVTLCLPVCTERGKS